MERIVHRLKLLYFIPIVIALLLVVCFETGLLTEGGLYDEENNGLVFVVTTVMELLSIAVIPAALRLFKMKKIQQALPSSPSALWRYGSIRLLMLMIPLLIDTLCYYLFIAVPFGYLAIILLLASVFVYPSASRCESETAKKNGEDV